MQKPVSGSLRWLATALSFALAASLLSGSAVLAADSATLEEETITYEEAYLQDSETEANEFLDSVDIEEELVKSSDDTTQEKTTSETAASTDVTLDGSGTTGVSSLSAASGIPPVAPEVQLLRIAPNDYFDGISVLAAPGRPGPREISNQVLSQSVSILSGGRASDMVWQWGQFLDHDIDLTEPDEEHPEHEDIPVPLGDPFFDPLGEGGKVIPFTRSVFDPATGTSTSNPREQINTITGFIDASNVYGSDLTRANALRTLDGTGRLKVSKGDFLPFNTVGLPNAGGSGRTDLFLAGDVRSNEQVVLSVMHNLWVREHNFWAREISKRRRFLTGDEIYEAARTVVMAEMQIITYQEFLPVILGSGFLPSYVGHNPTIDGRIANEFSTAAYRLGHTMLSPTILRLDGSGAPIAAGPLSLRDAFFAPTELTTYGLEPYLKGLASQIMQNIDSKVVDDVRNFLFGPPGAGGLDLASLNIQRGRDHGLPDYNSVRIAYGLAPKASFADITSDTNVQAQLSAAYGNVNDIDVWVGALAEDHVSGTLVGELLYTALVDQFQRLRDGDPDWYANVLNPVAAMLLEKQTLAKVIARNSTLKRSDLQFNVFVVP